MKRIFIIWVVTLVAWSCHEVTVGYLMVENASYSPDSLIVRKILDTSPGEPNPRYQQLLNQGYTPSEILGRFNTSPRINTGKDYDRDRLNLPWSSTPIEGMDGTAPIFVTVKSITTEVGNVDKLKDCLIVYGNGKLEIPLRHEIPAGVYKISLTFANEGYTKELDNIFTIIVK